METYVSVAYKQILLRRLLTLTLVCLFDVRLNIFLLLANLLHFVNLNFYFNSAYC